MKRYDVIWQIEWFPKDGDRLAGKIDVENLTTEHAREIIRAPKSDPMVGVFMIDHVIAQNLESISGIEFEFDKFDYFLGAVQRPGSVQ